MISKENSLLKRIMRKIKKDPQEVLLRASVPGGAILGAIYMVATTTAPPVIAGAIGGVVGAVGLPVAIMTSIILGVAVKAAVTSTPSKQLALLAAVMAAGIVNVVLVRPVQTIGKKFRDFFSRKQKQPFAANPSASAPQSSPLKINSVQTGFNAEASPVEQNIVTPSMAAPAPQQ